SGPVRAEQRRLVETQAKDRVTDRLLDLLIPGGTWEPDNPEENERNQRTREKMKARLEGGEMEDSLVELRVEQKTPPVQVLGAIGGMEQMEMDLQSMFERIMPRQSADKKIPIREARRILLEQETEGLIDRQVVAEKAVELAENQ